MAGAVVTCSGTGSSTRSRDISNDRSSLPIPKSTPRESLPTTRIAGARLFGTSVRIRNPSGASSCDSAARFSAQAPANFSKAPAGPAAITGVLGFAGQACDNRQSQSRSDGDFINEQPNGVFFLMAEIVWHHNSEPLRRSMAPEADWPAAAAKFRREQEKDCEDEVMVCRSQIVGVMKHLVPRFHGIVDIYVPART